jgi:uncharacterized protein
MSATPVSKTATDGKAEKERPPMIDTDVHEMMASPQVLRPYIDPVFENYLAGWAGAYWMSYAYPTETGFARADAVPETGPAGSDYSLMCEQHLDKHNVEAAILTSLFFPTDMHVQYEFATALASAYNDWLRENWLERDSRFRGSICVNANDPERAAKEIDRAAKHPAIVQVILGPLREAYGQEKFDPIFAAAERNGLAVAFHPSQYGYTAIHFPPYLIENRSMMAVQNHMSQLTSLVIGGVFERHPDLRAVWVEGGWTWVPSTMHRLDMNYRQLRVEVPWLKRLPSEYIREHNRFTTQPVEDLTADQFMTFVGLLGSEEMLFFATDYPHWDADDPYRALPRLPADVLSRLQYSNAKSFYGL